MKPIIACSVMLNFSNNSFIIQNGGIAGNLPPPVSFQITEDAWLFLCFKTIYAILSLASNIEEG